MFIHAAGFNPAKRTLAKLQYKELQQLNLDHPSLSPTIIHLNHNGDVRYRVDLLLPNSYTDHVCQDYPDHLITISTTDKALP